MTVELLPCSKCRRVPEEGISLRWPGDPRGVRAYGCACGHVETSIGAWNSRHGSPLTLAERPQDVPACDDEPSVGDGVRVVPVAASCVERWRSCEDALARWSVGACSGGVR